MLVANFFFAENPLVIISYIRLYVQIKDLFETFDTEHNSTTKAGKGRARKAVGEIKKLVTDYRKASVAENK